MISIKHGKKPTREQRKLLTKWKLQGDWNVINGYRQKVEQADPQLGEKCKALMLAVLQKMQAVLS